MDEITNSAESLDAFDAGWDDIDSSEEAEETETEEVTENEDADQHTEETENSEEEEAPESKSQEQEEAGEDADQQPQQPETFQLKYMGEILNVGRNEMISLAQQGKDYERVKAQRDEATAKIKELEAENGGKYKTFIQEMCAASDMDEQDFMDISRAGLLVEQEAKKGRTLSRELALDWVIQQRQKDEAEEAKNAASTEGTETEENTEQGSIEEARQKDEIFTFAMDFPDADVKNIPQEVWDDVNKGSYLPYAYAKYVNHELQEKIKVLEQNNKNRERSTGSRKSSGTGSSSAKDAFDKGWDSY